MGQDYVVEYLKGVRGINAAVSADQIGENELAIGTENVEPRRSGDGCLTKRYGIDYQAGYATANGHIAGLHYSLNDTIYLVKMENASLDADGNASLTLICYGNGTTIKSLSYRTDPCWTNAYISTTPYDVVSFSDGSAYKINASVTCSSVTGWPTGGRWCEYYNRYLFVCIPASNKLQWSNIDTIETWTGSDYFTLLPKPKALMKGIKRDDNNLVVFFDNCFVVLQGYGPTFNVIATNTFSGTKDNNSIVQTPYGLFWWDPNAGICRCRGNYLDVDYVSERKYPLRQLDKSLTTLYVSSGWPGYERINALWVPWQECVRFYVPCAYNNYYLGYRFDYYPRTDEFYFHTGKGCCITSAITVGWGSSQSRVYLGGHSSGGANKLYVEESDLYPSSTYPYSDEGTAITATIKTRKAAYSSFAAQKTLKSVIPRFKATASGTYSGALSYKYFINDATSATMTYDRTPTSTTVSQGLIGANHQMQMVQHVLTDTMAGTNIDYLGITEHGTVDQIL